MLTVGITYDASKDIFASGANQTAQVLSNVFKQLGYNTILLRTCGGAGGTNIYNAHTDILIDIDGFVDATLRKKVAPTSIVFLRGFVQFSEMDRSVYPEVPYRPRNFEGVAEIWCWDILNPPESLHAIQTLFPCPIRRVPFIWNSDAIDTHVEGGATGGGRTIHIAEKNNCNSSSSIIPLVAIRELTLHGGVKDVQYKCHNMEQILDNKFLKENVLNNIEIDKLPVEFVPWEAFYKWGNRDILFSHSRFTPLRLGLLNALWLGIPIVHNSPILKDLHPVLALTYYSGNCISEACNSLTKCIHGGTDTWPLNEIQDTINARWSIPNNLEGWREVCRGWGAGGDVKQEEDNKIIVAFSDFWPGFNFKENLIIDALQHETGIKIMGVEWRAGVGANLLVFGPFGETWKSVPRSIPKVFFSSENWGLAAGRADIKLYITSLRDEDDTHIRIPTWYIFIDWFSNLTVMPDGAGADNPIRIPLHFAMTPHPVRFNDRSEFCAFVVSNPSCNLRNEVFMAVNNYKQVNSGGGLYNNIGGQLSLKYPGGGGGDISKYHFFSKHKFTLSFENSQAAGYITEKVLHAKIAGCIPIYWGDAQADCDFVSGSIVNVSKLSNADDILKILQTVEEDVGLCEHIANTPLLDERMKDKALSAISRMAKKLLEIIGGGKRDVEVEDKKLEGIDKIFLINLDRRQDRLVDLFAAEPWLDGIVERISAVDGNTLELTPYIYSLFKGNNFNWKKSVMGCALSHIIAWTKILSDSGAGGDRFLILEDDVRFKSEIGGWTKYVREIPDDAELLYIGGVLPPNMKGLDTVLEPVNSSWARIKPNTLFTRGAAVPLFHFCTYSYILTRVGAEKLIRCLSKDNMPCAIDHFLGRCGVDLKTYVATPLITKCFQDDNPLYQVADFNAGSGVGEFDSDIINNGATFNKEELEEYECTKFYHMTLGDETQLYEHEWIQDMFGKYSLHKIEDVLGSNFENDSWFIVQRPEVDSMMKLLKGLSGTFRVLHLSDEFGADNIDFYSLPNCAAVVRNYWRGGLGGNVKVIPLGYHHKLAGGGAMEFSKRELVWSFHGNAWFDRPSHLEPFYSLQPHSCHFVNEWNSPDMTRGDKYLEDMANSKFCPILRGNNVETYRLYEALEVGTIPVYVRCRGDEEFWSMISSKLQLIGFNSWTVAGEAVQYFIQNPDAAEAYRQKLVANWLLWKSEIRGFCRNV